MATDLERLKVAFALYVTRKIVNADDSVHPDEVKLVHDMFPSHKLEALGFLEPGSPKLTAAFQAARQEAVADLPKRLTTPEKEEFVRWFRQVCQADGHVDNREEQIVAQVEKILGLR